MGMLIIIRNMVSICLQVELWLEQLCYVNRLLLLFSCILYCIYSALNQILFSCYGVIWQKTNDCQNKFVSIAFYL